MRILAFMCKLNVDGKMDLFSYSRIFFCSFSLQRSCTLLVCHFPSRRQQQRCISRPSQWLAHRFAFTHNCKAFLRRLFYDKFIDIHNFFRHFYHEFFVCVLFAHFVLLFRGTSYVRLAALCVLVFDTFPLRLLLVHYVFMCPLNII